MDNLRLGALNFIDCIPVSYKIYLYGPRYNFLLKITLGAVIKLLNHTKQLQFYSNELCEIPSNKELRKFLKPAREEIL